MIFSELYGTYYNAVAHILRIAVKGHVTDSEIRSIIEKEAFSESILTIEPALKEERWQLLRKNGSTPLKHSPEMPLTLLQKRWLKSISMDPRIKLFDFKIAGLDDIEPLFRKEYLYVFDKYSDGDRYEDSGYIERFKIILNAIKNRKFLSIYAKVRGGSTVRVNVMPEYLEYSEKDDKFRLIVSGNRRVKTINLGRIISCAEYVENKEKNKEYNKEYGKEHNSSIELRPPQTSQYTSKIRTVVMELIDERNTLERAFMHFAHFEKRAERLKEDGSKGRYRLTVKYDLEDEAEIVIRVLSFGPLIKVIEPESFVNLIKERLISQKSCGL